MNTYHTYDLLKLLKDVRKERSNAFKLLSTTLRISNNKKKVHEDMKNATEDNYRRFTAYVYLIEGILIDRIGYKPKRIDDKLLTAWALRIGLKKI